MNRHQPDQRTLTAHEDHELRRSRAVSGLQALLPKPQDREDILVSMPYLTVLNYAAKRVQFLLGRL